jgi:hypothetical protein
LDCSFTAPATRRIFIGHFAEESRCLGIGYFAKAAGGIGKAAR